MNVILYFVAVICFLNGVFYYAAAQSAIHQILASVSMLIAAVLFGSAAIIGSIKKSSLRQVRAMESFSSKVHQPPPSPEEILIESVKEEVESGSIDPAIWDMAKAVAKKSGLPVNDEYQRLRLKSLKQKQATQRA